MTADLLKRVKHRLSHRGYANILAVLRHRPSTATQVATTIATSERTTKQVLVRMVELEIAHVTSWEHKLRAYIPVYGFGPGDSAPYPGKKRPHRVRNARNNFRPDLLAFSNVIKALIEGPTTKPDLHDLSGLNPVTVRLLINHCRQIKLIYIADWFQRTQAAGPPSPMYAVGSKADKPRPLPQSNTENCRRYGLKRRARERLLVLIPSLRAQRSTEFADLAAAGVSD
jgi:hypothetical protein